MLGPLHEPGPVESGVVGGTPPEQVPERQSLVNLLVGGSYLNASIPPPCAGATISARPSPSISPTATDEGASVASSAASKENCCEQSLPLMTRITPGLL